MPKAVKKEAGTVLRGDDGSLFFVPDAALEAFRLTEKSSKPLQALFRNLTVGNTKGIDPRAAGPSDPTISIVDIGALRRAAAKRR